MKFYGRVINTESETRCDLLFHGGGKKLKISGDHGLSDKTIIRGEYDPSDDRIIDYTMVSAGDSSLAQVYEILDKFAASPLYPEEVLQQTEQMLAAPGLDDPGLTDLTALPFVTIDNENSRDLDQALYISKEKNGFTVYYALADAAWYVRPGTPLMAEALKRGASFYLAGISVAMLPKELSEGLISLNPDQLRRSLVFIHRTSESCSVVETEVKQALIRSRAKLSYKGVQEFYDNPEKSPLLSREFTESLLNLKEFGQGRISLAGTSSGIPFTRNEMEAGLSADGKNFVFSSQERNMTSKYNEQLSLLCNEEGAKILSGKSLGQYNNQAIYRVHESPDEESLTELHETIKEICLKKNLSRDWYWDKEEPLGRYLNRLHGMEIPPLSMTIEHMVRRTFKRSAYVKEPALHYALGVEHYARFSSPMREIVGIFLHKELLEALDLLKPESTALEDIVLREKVIEAANRSKDKQKNLDREIERRAMAGFFNLPENAKRSFKGIVTGINKTRIYVLLNHPSIEVKVYLSYGPIASKKIPVAFGPAEITVGSRTYMPGDEITLTVGEFDSREKKWYFVPE